MSDDLQRKGSDPEKYEQEARHLLSSVNDEPGCSQTFLLCDLGECPLG